MKKSNTSETIAFLMMLFGIFTLLLLILAVAIQSKVQTDPVEHQQYTTTGYYYDGYVIRDDGHIWDYTSTYFVEPNNPVILKFDDNGTPEEVTDDYIVLMAHDYTRGYN